MKKLFSQYSWCLAILGLLVVYLATHLFGLVKLPVFADEAIYVRWAQLIMDDAGRYAFFPLNDGKTPLFIWSLIPWQHVFSDQLFAGRFVSVLVGLGQIFVMMALTRELGLGKKWQFLSGLLVVLLPFWFFYHRMALMDGMLVLWLSLSWLAVLKAIKQQSWWWTLGVGVFFGAAMLTKLPAILFVSSLGLAALLPFITNKSSTSKLVLTQEKILTFALQFALAGSVGLGLFLLLKFNPAFGQLFSRGGDFLFKLPELTFLQIGKNIWFNGLNFTGVLGAYLGWASLILIFSALFSKKHRLTLLVLIGMALVFMTPIQLLGKVIYPRYLLPAALPLTLALVFAIEACVELIEKQKNWLIKLVQGVLFAVLISNICTSAARFTLYSWLNPNLVPFTLADQVQYLIEWSAGNGIVEVSTAALNVSEKSSLLILTEGYFGTLPDGLLMYLHGRKLENLFVEGIGQPIMAIPPQMIEKSQRYDRVWLVINSHRLKLVLPKELLIGQYCRLPEAPCLQIWDIKPYLLQLPKE